MQQQTNKQIPVLYVESQTWRWTETRERDWVHRLVVTGFIRELVSQGGGCWRDMQTTETMKRNKETVDMTGWQRYSCNMTQANRCFWIHDGNTHSMNYMLNIWDHFWTLRWNLSFMWQLLLTSNEWMNEVFKTFRTQSETENRKQPVSCQSLQTFVRTLVRIMGTQLFSHWSQFSLLQFQMISWLNSFKMNT